MWYVDRYLPTRTTWGLKYDLKMVMAAIFKIVFFQNMYCDILTKFYTQTSVEVPEVHTLM